GVLHSARIRHYPNTLRPHRLHHRPRLLHRAVNGRRPNLRGGTRLEVHLPLRRPLDRLQLLLGRLPAHYPPRLYPRLRQQHLKLRQKEPLTYLRLRRTPLAPVPTHPTRFSGEGIQQTIMDHLPTTVGRKESPPTVVGGLAG